MHTLQGGNVVINNVSPCVDGAPRTFLLQRDSFRL